MVRPLRRNSPLLLGVAALVGVLVGFGLSTIGSSTGFQLLGQPYIAPNGDTPSPCEIVALYHDASSHSTQSSASSAESKLQYLNNMVARTNGFYARDYSLWLGWNNMRYIIETAILHGHILNRTTIIPSFAYARACEFDLATCAAYATMVNRGDATHLDEWRDLPIEQQMAWKIPISIMFNLTHLQQSHAVITTEDYFRLHNISVDVESTDGHWDVDTYHVRDAAGDTRPSLHAIENWWYDPDELVRVDYIPQDMRQRGGWSSEGGDRSHDQAGSWTNPTPDTEVYHALMEALPSGRPILDWDTVRRIVTDGSRIRFDSSVEEIGGVLRENGFEVVYTYDGAAGYESAKHVILPAHKAVPRDRIRGLYEDFRGISSQVLLLRGEVHDGRKPGSLCFTSTTSRTHYTQTILYDMRLTDGILSLAERISDRMFAMNGGRLWMAAHMRRGDFTRLGWAMLPDFAAHLARIKQNLQLGREVLLSVRGGNATVYDIPDAQPDPLLLTLDPPNPDDKYYIATDERDPENLKYLREQGAVLISDLLTTEDHREYEWPILFTDALALVEQSVMSRAAYFFAHASSSVAGGVMNLRGGLGKDPRTARVG